MPVKISYSNCWKDGKCGSCSCKGACIGCAEACPVGAITRKRQVQIDASLCISCGACVAACNHNALSLE